MESVDHEPATAGGEIGRYLLVSRLGEGGMGEIWRATDPRMGRDVAIKVLRDVPNASLVNRFSREARVTGQLQHPNIVPVYEFSSTPEGGLYMTMRPVEGETLSDVIARPAANRDSARLRLLQIFLKVCDAIEYAHERGVLHRDLKPSNVMVGRFGDVLVMDWGLAAVLDEGAPPDVVVVGTPAYMAPEQARGGAASLDCRTDIYGLGAILYEILTGASPREAIDRHAVLQRVLDGDLVPPRERAPAQSIPWELEAVVLKAMASDPARRYASVGALKADLEAFLAGRMLLAPRYALTQRIALLVRRHRRGIMGALLVVVLVGSALVARGWIRESDRVAQDALRERDRFRPVEPELARALVLRGHVHLTNGQLEPAVRAYAQAIEIDPNNADAYVGRGRALARRGEHAAAVADYGRAVALGMNEWEAYEERGLLLVQLGAYREALSDFDRLAEGWPLHSWGFYFRGLVRLILGERDVGLADLARAAAGNVNEPKVRLWQCALTGDLGHLDGFVETPAPGLQSRAGGPRGELGWLIGYFRGTTSAEALFSRIDGIDEPALRADVRTRAETLLAAEALRRGESSAVGALERIEATRNTSSIEYHWACATLRRCRVR